MAFFVVLLFWAGGFFWKREGWLRIHQIDVDTHRRQLPWDEINEYRERVAAMPKWKRFVHAVFV